MTVTTGGRATSRCPRPRLAELDVERLEQLPVLFLRRDDLNVVIQLGPEQLQGLVVDRLGSGHHLTEMQHDWTRDAGFAPILSAKSLSDAPRTAVPPGRCREEPGRRDRRRLHVVELLTTLLLRLPAPGRPPAGPPESALSAAAAAAAARTGRTTAGPCARSTRTRSAATRARTGSGSGTTASAAATTTGLAPVPAPGPLRPPPGHRDRYLTGRPGRHVHRLGRGPPGRGPPGRGPPSEVPPDGQVHVRPDEDRQTRRPARPWGAAGAPAGCPGRRNESADGGTRRLGRAGGAEPCRSPSS